MFYNILILLAFITAGKGAYAHNVAMVQTTKFLSPETVDMLVQRANSGGAAGFQVGDTIKYIIKYKPVPNQGNTGVNGYVTDYIPDGLQVTGVAFEQPDGFGGYYEVPPAPAGDMANTAYGNSLFGGTSTTPLLLATPANISAEITSDPGYDPFLTPANQGTLAQWYADVGIWYSTDTRTRFDPLVVTARSRNNWDFEQSNYDFSCGGWFTVGADGPWGTGSPVAGPQTFYQNEIVTPVDFILGCQSAGVGPWQRIGVSGSRIGDYGLLGDFQASRALFPGDPLYGRDLATNPLPVASSATPVTIRWANGLNAVGQVKYVSVTAQIVSLPPGGTIINNSEVWGGDVVISEGGVDNAWKYNDTLVSIGNNSDLTVIKTSSTETAMVGDVVTFQITIINTGASTQTNLVATDYLQASQPIFSPFITMVAYNCDASGAAVYGGVSGVSGITMTPSACPSVGLVPGDRDEAIAIGGVEALQWTVASLVPGASQTYTYSVTALGSTAFGATSAAGYVLVTSDQLAAAGATAGASFEIGDFPILNQNKTVNKSSVIAGDTVRYHIQITNDGAVATGIWQDPNSLISYAPLDFFGTEMPTTIVDTLPAGFSYAGNTVLTIDGVTLTNVTLGVLGNDVTWTISHGAVSTAGINGLPSGGTLDLYFDALVSVNLAAGVYKNTVSTSMPYNKNPGQSVPPFSNDWVYLPLLTSNTADVIVGEVQLNKVATPSTVTNTLAGTSTSYTITVTNNRTVAATGVTVTDTLPIHFTYQANSTTGTAAIAEPSVSGQSVTWPAFDVPANSSRTIVFNANIATTALPAAYLSDVTATSTNVSIPDLLNTAQVVVVLPGLSVAKTVDRAVISWLGDGVVAPVSETLNYTITLTNSGEGFAVANVADQLPEGFFFPQGGTETVTMTVAGVAQVMLRGVSDNLTTYTVWPGSVAGLPIEGTRVPNWGTFTLPPKQLALDTTLTITFPIRIDMMEAPVLPTVAVSQAGLYPNTVTISGNEIVPPFNGAAVNINRPVSKSTTTASVIASAEIGYRFQVDNQDIYTWTGVSVVDYLGTLSPLTVSGVTYSGINAAYYAIGVTEPVGVPGVDAAWLLTTPVFAAPTLTFNNGGAGFVIPSGQSLFVAYTATAPPAVPVPAEIHNSLQSLTYTSNLVVHTLANVWDGGLPTNTAENVIVTAAPTVDLTGTKTVTPSELHLYGLPLANTVTYSVTLSNADPVTTATGIIVTDTLPAGFSFAAGDTASIVINGGAAIAITPTAHATIPNAWDFSFAANAIPALGNAVLTFTASVAASTAANTYYNSVSWIGTNVNAGNLGSTAAVVIDPVTINKQALSTSVVAGGVATYRITITNGSSLPLNALSVTDYLGDVIGTLPSGLTYQGDAVVTMAGTPWVAGVDYTLPVVSSATPTWAFTSSVDVAATLTIDFYANVPSNAVAGTVHNSISNLTFTPGALAQVVATNVFDGANVAHTADDITISTLGISKAVVNPYATVINDAVLGTLTKYIITVTNGSAVSQTVDVQDVLPTGFSYQVSSTLINGVVAADPVVVGQTLTWAGQAAAVGNTTIEFTALIANTVVQGNYTNQVDVLVGALVVDSFSGATVTVTAPQIFLSKITTTPSVGKDSYANYTPAHYKLSITNTGSADAIGVKVTDTLPVNFSFDPSTLAISINNTPLLSGYAIPAPLTQTFTFDTNPVAGFTVPAAVGLNNGNLTIEYDALIVANTVPLLAGHDNTASAVSDNAGSLGPVVSTVQLYDIGLSKATSTPSRFPNDVVTYTITINNSGVAAIPNVVVSDALPLGIVYINATTTGVGWTVAEPNLVNGSGLPIWTIPLLAANSTATITFNALVQPTVTAGTYYSSVIATGNFGAIPTVPFPNTSLTAPVTVTIPLPSLIVLKSANLAATKPGTAITYTITVTNTGEGQADLVTVTNTISGYSKLAIAPFAGVVEAFKFIDGLNPSGFNGAATVTYSADQGATFTNGPLVDDGSGHDPTITNFKLNMTGTMNANPGNPPSFQIQYQVEVK